MVCSVDACLLACCCGLAGAINNIGESASRLNPCRTCNDPRDRQSRRQLELKPGQLSQPASQPASGYVRLACLLA